VAGKTGCTAGEHYTSCGHLLQAGQLIESIVQRAAPKLPNLRRKPGVRGRALAQAGVAPRAQQRKVGGGERPIGRAMQNVPRSKSAKKARIY